MTVPDAGLPPRQPNLFSGQAADPDDGALLSADGRYRYRLWRLWDRSLPPLVFVMLNPSTADAETDDPTLRKCMGFASRNGAGGVVVVNLFALRSTDRHALPTAEDPVGPENDAHLEWAARAWPHSRIVAAWGGYEFASARARKVRALLAHRPLECLGQTKGRPWHPLYLRYDTPLSPFEEAR